MKKLLFVLILLIGFSGFLQNYKKEKEKVIAALDTEISKKGNDCWNV
ncbi:hypothetical protein [Flavobacterium sp. SM2513]